MVHGEDFTSMGIQSELDWLETEFAKHFELNIRGRLGENCTGPQQIRILNRIVTLTPKGLTYEADPRHVDLLSSSLGLTSANSVATPGVKDPNPDSVIYLLSQRFGICVTCWWYFEDCHFHRRCDLL